MAAKLSDLQEAFARLSMLEFVLENLVAIQLAAIPESESEAFKADLRSAFQNPRGSGTARQFQVIERVQQLADQFLEKASEAETRIRTDSPPQKPRAQ